MPVRPGVDIADDTFVARPPEVLAAVVGDPARWPEWWPDLQVEVTRDRGVEGVRWAVRGAVTGSMEIWLEPCPGGTVLHWYLRPGPDPRPARRAARSRDRRVRAWKAVAFALKDRLEAVDRET